jgi:hypothetical protein
MKTRDIQTIADFHAAIETTYDYNPIFRGENKADYILRSKYGRFAAQNKLNDLDAERETLEEFSRRAVSFLESDPKNDWEMLAIAQHHGLATRLLDWTRNPLVAAYFATRDFLSKSVIYVMDEFTLENTNCAQSPFDIDEDLIYRPRHTAARITSQAGLFTVHHDPIAAFAPPTLERWVLDTDTIIDLRTMLDVYGITCSHIFPGLDSICREIHERHIRAFEGDDE